MDILIAIIQFSPKNCIFTFFFKNQQLIWIYTILCSCLSPSLPLSLSRSFSISLSSLFLMPPSLLSLSLSLPALSPIWWLSRPYFLWSRNPRHTHSEYNRCGVLDERSISDYNGGVGLTDDCSYRHLFLNPNSHRLSSPHFSFVLLNFGWCLLLLITILVDFSFGLAWALQPVTTYYAT